MWYRSLVGQYDVINLSIAVYTIYTKVSVPFYVSEYRKPVGCRTDLMIFLCNFININMMKLFDMSDIKFPGLAKNTRDISVL